ncbi:2'-5' RNA ligase family protein [Georgenia halophila]|uniref:2'-5' RNA ligase family protein n=1 Tax=Georgenia halophila TaxID=620889 RepID=A0ABP8LEP1_9MICO
MVAVGEAEPAVGKLRRELDPVARLGVPAHVTILFPFMPSEQLDDDVMLRLTGLFRSVPAFEHEFVRSAWFGDEVLWLASDADAVFRSLTKLVADAFPEYPPYEGQFDDVVPHLTIAAHGPLDAMQAADRTVQPHLPISTITRAVTLMVERPTGGWEAAESFALGD